MNVSKEIANSIGVNYELNKSTADLIDFLVDNDMNFERASGYWKIDLKRYSMKCIVQKVFKNSVLKLIDNYIGQCYTSYVRSGSDCSVKSECRTGAD